MKEREIKKVNVINKTTKEIIKTFDSVASLLKEFQMSRTKLRETIESKSVYKNWIFEYA